MELDRGELTIHFYTEGESLMDTVPLRVAKARELEDNVNMKRMSVCVTKGMVRFRTEMVKLEE